MMTRISLFAVLILASCRSEPAEQRARQTVVPPPLPTSEPPLQGAVADSSELPQHPASDWLTYDGGAFAIRYPPNATLVEARSHPRDVPGTAIVGPTIHVPVAPDVGPSDGPAYRLIVASLPNPKHLSSAEWVEAVRGEANNGPMDADSMDFIRPADSLQIGSTRFLRLRPPCGDCAPEELYLAAGDRMAMLSYIFDISVPGDRDRQRKVYEAILGTFRAK